MKKITDSSFYSFEQFAYFCDLLSEQIARSIVCKLQNYRLKKFEYTCKLKFNKICVLQAMTRDYVLNLDEYNLFLRIREMPYTLEICNSNYVMGMDDYKIYKQIARQYDRECALYILSKYAADNIIPYSRYKNLDDILNL